MAKKKDEEYSAILGRLENLSFSISGYPTRSKEYPALYELPEDIQSALFDLQKICVPTVATVPVKSEGGDAAELVIADGVTVIYGPSGTGKSRLLNYIITELDGLYIRFHEPELPAITSVGKFIKLLISALLNPDVKVIGVDSFRFFLYNNDAKAAAMSGGINASFFTELTSLNILAASLGKKLIIISNFLSENPNNESTIKNAISGSTEGFIRTFIEATGNLIEFNSRNDVSRRNSIYYRNPAISSDEANLDEDSVKEDNVVVDVDSTIADFTSAFRRMLLNTNLNKRV